MKGISLITPSEAAIFRTRAKLVNQEVGLLALSLGCAALGTDAPRTFALLAMGAVMIFMAYRLQSFDRTYRLWREVKHPLVEMKIVWRFFPLFNIGWCLLTLVAIGVLTKHGIPGTPPW